MAEGRTSLVGFVHERWQRGRTSHAGFIDERKHKPGGICST